jgi:hypothetical protein
LKSLPSAPAIGSWTQDSLADLLAPALGREQSAELVAGAAARLGLLSARFDDIAAISIIDQLSEGSGLVAVSARFARARMVHRRTALPPKISSLPPEWIPRAKPYPPAAAAADRPSKRRTWQLSEVSGLLANALGKERSEEIVIAEAERRKLSEPLETEDVLRLLGGISESGGVVGTVAQFAKSRLMLAKRG